MNEEGSVGVGEWQNIYREQRPLTSSYLLPGIVEKLLLTQCYPIFQVSIEAGNLDFYVQLSIFKHWQLIKNIFRPRVSDTKHICGKAVSWKLSVHSCALDFS